MIRITGLSEAVTRLAQLDLPAAQARGADAAARLLHDAISTNLSHPPGANPALPALRTGSLRASLTQASDAGGAVIASTSPVAVYQELGTARMAPRPFLAPAASQHADGAAHAIADALRAGTNP